MLALVLVGGFAWYERSRPPARVVALVAALAALAIAGRLALAPVPNVVATTDIALITGYALGGPPGFAVGALARAVSNLWLGQGPWTAVADGGLGAASASAAPGWRRSAGRAARALGPGGRLRARRTRLRGAARPLGDGHLRRRAVAGPLPGALGARASRSTSPTRAGNFAIALVAGPALVRMISRFRDRLEFRWRPAGALPAAADRRVAAGAALAPAGPRPVARPPADARAAGPEAGARWLARAQNPDGGFAASPGGPSSPAMTGWAMLGLEARGPQPARRCAAAAGRRSPTCARTSRGCARPATSSARSSPSPGRDSTRAGSAGRDLVAELRARRDRDGSSTDRST